MNMNAAIKAIETVDSCIGKIVNATGEMGGSIIITADHGNAEVMKGPSGEPWTAHTTNKVPLIFIEGEKRKIPHMGNDIYLRDMFNVSFRGNKEDCVTILQGYMTNSNTGNNIK